MFDGNFKHSKEIEMNFLECTIEVNKEMQAHYECHAETVA